MAERWQGWLLTGEAMLELVIARIMIRFVAIRHWNKGLGKPGTKDLPQDTVAWRIARHVHRAAQRLPLESKCLPRAMALSRMLGRRSIDHRLVIAARPARQRSGADNLHAWIEVDGVTILGDLPGPWAVIHRIPENSIQL